MCSETIINYSLISHNDVASNLLHTTMLSPAMETSFHCMGFCTNRRLEKLSTVKCYHSFSRYELYASSLQFDACTVLWELSGKYDGQLEGKEVCLPFFNG